MENPCSNHVHSDGGDAEQKDPKPACINNNEAAEVIAEAGKDQEVLKSTEAEYCELGKRDKARDTSRVSMFSEFKMLLGDASL